MFISRSKALALAGGALGCGLLLLGAATARVVRVTSPPRQPSSNLDFDSVGLGVSAVRFAAVDGVPLAGWWMPGDPGRAPVILCHDLGSSKADLAELGIRLHDDGFPVLLFDFRGHGESGGGRSTLGLKEKRDVLGAVGYLAQALGREPRRIGVYGVGMGAYAALLAAADRPAIRVLVLDGLYPDVSYPLARRVYSGWELGVERLAGLPVAVFLALSSAPSAGEGAAGVLRGLTGRDLLLLAPEGDAELTREIRHLYDTIPVQTDVEGNLLVLPATRTGGLFGEELARYDAAVGEFLRTRLKGS